MKDISRPIIKTVLIPADSTGCSHYRMIFPAMVIKSMFKDILYIETYKYILDKDFYNGIKNVMVQRHVSEGQLKSLEMLKLLSLQYNFWLTYNIDDVVSPDDIPKYNRSHKIYKELIKNETIKKSMDLCDFIVVTTDDLKNYYMNKFQQNPNKFIIIPNFLPRWWVGECYNLDKISHLYDKHKNKPRILFTSSSAHYDMDGSNNYIDDFTHINDFIIRNIDKYQFVFIGGLIPKQLEPYKDKLEIYPGYDILNFIREVNSKECQLIIAPLQNNIFNICKSNIKLIEGWALGIPVIAQNLPNYSKYTDLIFNDSNDLETVVEDVLSNKNKYLDIVKNCRNIVDFGDENQPNGYWLEKNINYWFPLFNMQNKSLYIDLNLYKKIENGILNNRSNNKDIMVTL